MTLLFHHYTSAVYSQTITRSQLAKKDYVFFIEYASIIRGSPKEFLEIIRISMLGKKRATSSRNEFHWLEPHQALFYSGRTKNAVFPVTKLEHLQKYLQVAVACWLDRIFSSTDQLYRRLSTQKSECEPNNQTFLWALSKAMKIIPRSASVHFWRGFTVSAW